jgi:hypothetical protein
LALAGLAVLTGLTLWLSVRALTYPHQLLDGDGWMYVFARRLAAGEPLYKPLGELPLGTCNYPPLTLLLARMLFPVLGPSYAAGRIWPLLATLAVAAILFSWVQRATKQALPAAAAALAWMGAPYVYHWTPQFRADLPGLAFSLAGVFLVWRSSRVRSLALAALLFAAGLYCKHSFLAAPAAAFLALWLTAKRREAALLAGSTLLAGGAPFLVLNVTTQGAFWNSMVSANVNAFELGRLFTLVADFVRTYAVLMVLALAALVLWVKKRDALVSAGPQSRTSRVIPLYVLTALATCVLAGKAGAWENYFLEPLAALCLGAGVALARLRLSTAGRWLAPGLLLVQAALMWHTPTVAAEMLREDPEAIRVLLPQVAAAPGLVLSEDVGLLVEAGKPVPHYNFQLTQLAKLGRWDEKWEVDNLRRGAFPMVILENDTRLDVDRYGRYSRAFVSALDYGYRFSGRVGKYQVFRPAPLDRERPIRFEGGPALVGHTLPPVDSRPGATLSLDLVWQATRPMTETYTSFLHLLGADGQGYAGHDLEAWVGLYPTTSWAGGEMVRMSYTLTLPVDLPPGLYTLTTGWYDGTLRRLVSERGQDAVPIAVLRVPTPPSTAPEPGPESAAEFEQGIRLTAYRLTQSPDSLEVTLTWEPTHFLDADYTVFVHLTPSQGPAQPLAQGDGPPAAGRWPTSLWVPGQTVDDAHTVALPAGLPAGSYRLWVGLYDARTRARLHVNTGADAVLLAEITLP